MEILEDSGRRLQFGKSDKAKQRAERRVKADGGSRKEEDQNQGQPVHRGPKENEKEAEASKFIKHKAMKSWAKERQRRNTGEGAQRSVMMREKAKDFKDGTTDRHVALEDNCSGNGGFFLKLLIVIFNSSVNCVVLDNLSCGVIRGSGSLLSTV